MKEWKPSLPNHWSARRGANGAGYVLICVSLFAAL